MFGLKIKSENQRYLRDCDITARTRCSDVTRTLHKLAVGHSAGRQCGRGIA